MQFNARSWFLTLIITFYLALNNALFVVKWQIRQKKSNTSDFWHFLIYSRIWLIQTNTLEILLRAGQWHPGLDVRLLGLTPEQQTCRPSRPPGCWRRRYLSRSLGRLPSNGAPAALSCSDTAVFADWTAGVVTPHTGGGSANPLASPQGVSDGGLALAGMTEQQIEMNSNPPPPPLERTKSNHEQEGDCDPASNQCCDHPGGG